MKRSCQAQNVNRSKTVRRCNTSAKVLHCLLGFAVSILAPWEGVSLSGEDPRHQLVYVRQSSTPEAELRTRPHGDCSGSVCLITSNGNHRSVARSNEGALARRLSPATGTEARHPHAETRQGNEDKWLLILLR
ncbi:hypothetical protein NDU88_006345 [Pleurodeles waltl]|uniref:Uncharacterized protein n=1 Tax=Pleurodeles waltl TaxID=8319 RepID=A0AAV7SPA7_PLEWA|nr:hypothetical protein NDU88_006345 [Pleurodeles waltl]